MYGIQSERITWYYAYQSLAKSLRIIPTEQSALPDNLLDRLRKNPRPRRQILLRDVERGDEADHLVHARRQNQHPLLLAPLRDAPCQVLRRAGLRERVVRACPRGRRKLDGDHEPLAAHVEYARRDRGIRPERIQRGEQFFRARRAGQIGLNDAVAVPRKEGGHVPSIDVLEDILLLHHVRDSDRRRTRHRVPGVRPALSAAARTSVSASHAQRARRTIEPGCSLSVSSFRLTTPLSGNPFASPCARPVSPTRAREHPRSRGAPSQSP